MSGYKLSMREKLSEKFDLPADTSGNQPRITVIGYREVVIYGHKGVTECGSERICIATGKATVKITGLELTIKAMNAENISVVGQLIGIEFTY